VEIDAEYGFLVAQALHANTAWSRSSFADLQRSKSRLFTVRLRAFLSEKTVDKRLSFYGSHISRTSSPAIHDRAAHRLYQIISIVGLRVTGVAISFYTSVGFGYNSFPQHSRRARRSTVTFAHRR
jgi:hypothetical protein